MNIDLAECYQSKIKPASGEPAAIIVPLVVDVDSGECELLLLRRNAQMNAYPGDWCFPGGKMSDGDRSLDDTAWRELEEETSISERDCHLVCQLDDFYSGKGDLVRPYLITVSKNNFNVSYKPNSTEIDMEFLVGFNELSQMCAGSPPGRVSNRTPAHYMTFGDGAELVWGLTAGVIMHVYNVITGEDCVIDYGEDYVR